MHDLGEVHAAGRAQQNGEVEYRDECDEHAAQRVAVGDGHLAAFGIEIEDCARCGGRLRIIARIEEPEVIAKILAHLERVAPGQNSARR